MAPVVGVELSTSSSFPQGSTTMFYTRSLIDGRKFIVSATGMKESTTYYFRTSYPTTGINGETRSFTTETTEAVMSKMKISTGNASEVMDTYATIPLSGNNTGVAYAKDAALLTLDNVKAAINGSANGVLLSRGNYLPNLASGTTYYYCEYRRIKQYVAIGEVKSFTTSGYKSDELAKQMTISINLNEATQIWTATIQSSLSMPGKTIKYSIKPMMRTSYAEEGHEWSVEWIWKDGADSDGSAVQNGNTYYASIENPYYNATYYGYRIEDWWAQWWVYSDENADFWMDVEVVREIAANIRKGTATADERDVYDVLFPSIKGNMDAREPEYAKYVKNYLQVVVEIDGSSVVVKEQEGKLRIPVFEDNPLFNYSDLTIN